MADDRRIAETLPTLKYLESAGARTILMSHLGRPEGRRDPQFSLRPVARRLSSLLGRPVAFADDCVGIRPLEASTRLGNGDFLLLENLRFHAGETANDPAFAAQLAQLGEIFVEEAFGTVHRAHASTVGLPKRLPSFAGLLVAREIEELSRLVDRVARPYAVLVGGAKVRDKLPLLASFLGRADRLMIGGSLSFPFLRAQGFDLGSAPAEPGLEDAVQEFLARAKEMATTVYLPTDLVAEVQGNERPEVVAVNQVPSGGNPQDIGPATRETFVAGLQGTRTVFWNGPLGRIEDLRFLNGTRDVLTDLARVPGYHVCAGGDSARTVRDLGVESAFQYISTGGGAALEFVQGEELPGLTALPNA